MSVNDLSDPNEGAIAMATRVPETCFCCGQPLAPIIVHWHGIGSEISMHPSCAERLGLRLAVDARHAQLILEGKEPLAGVHIAGYLARGSVTVP